MVQRVSADNAIYAMDPKNKPVLMVEPGEEVVFETKDCFSNQLQKDSDDFSSIGWDNINPATGPVAVKGAQPGDTLVVDILEIKTADKGVMITYPEFGSIGARATSQTKIVDIKGDKAELFRGIEVPLNKMIGVIGVAPAAEPVPTGTPGPHGGNMDNKRIGIGTRLFLPVFVEGANLAMGDLHAAMADGEICVTGVEAPGEVRVKVDVIKGRRIDWPRLESADDYMVICSAATLDEAVQLCIDQMLDEMIERTGLPLNEAGMLLSIVGQTQICQVVDPLKTARMVVPKWALEKRA